VCVCVWGGGGGHAVSPSAHPLQKRWRRVEKEGSGCPFMNTDYRESYKWVTTKPPRTVKLLLLADIYIYIYVYIYIYIYL